MIKLSILDSAARQAARSLRPWCSTCEKQVEHVEEPFMHPTATVHVVFRCHGRREEISLDPDKEAPLKDWPRRLFLRNWAGYTIRPKRAEGRRL